jgi:predicted dehydrogenase
MVRWAIIGTGKIANTMAVTLESVPDAHLVAVVSRSPDRARAFAGRHGAASTFTDAAALIPSDVDAAYVASTNDHHIADAVACLESGIPVLLEKPVAIDEAGAAVIVAVARRTGTFLMEAMWMRFQPYWTLLASLISDGAAGTVRTISADFGFPAPAVPASRLFNAEQGGGALLDIGIYPITFAALLAGEPSTIAAVETRAGTGVDDQMAMAMLHEGAVVSSLSCSLVSDTAIEATVAGSDGRIRVRAQFHHSPALELWRRGDLVETFDVAHAGTGYQFEVEEVQRCIALGLSESPVHPLSDTLMVMRTIDRVRVAAR